MPRRDAMGELDPDAHYVLQCMFKVMREVDDPDDSEALRSFFERVRGRHPRPHDPDIARTIRRLLADPDADLGEFAGPDQLRDGGAHVRRCLATIAPWYRAYLHVEERDVAALRRWYDEDRPIRELHDYVLGELRELEPEQRGDAARVAFEYHPRVDNMDAKALADAVTMLAAREISPAVFEAMVHFYARRRRASAT